MQGPDSLRTPALRGKGADGRPCVKSLCSQALNAGRVKNSETPSCGAPSRHVRTDFPEFRISAENMVNKVDKNEIFVKIDKVQKAYAFFMVCKQTMRQGLYAGITKKFGGL